MKKFILAVLAAFSMTACVFAASTTPQINWDKGLNSNIVVFGSGSSHVLAGNRQFVTEYVICQVL